MKTKELKEQIEFEETLNNECEWRNAYFNNSEFDNILIKDNYGYYIIYTCWDREDLVRIFRNKKKNGSELK